MTQREENQKEKLDSPSFCKPIAGDRGQVHICQNLIANLLEKGDSPCKREFP